MKHLLHKICLVLFVCAPLTTLSAFRAYTPPGDPEVSAAKITVPIVGNKLIECVTTNNFLTLHALFKALVTVKRSRTFYCNALQVLLMHATCQNKPDFVHEAIKKGVNVNYKNPEGKTALSYAMANGNMEIISMLIRAGAICTPQEKAEIRSLHTQHITPLNIALVIANLILLQCHEDYINESVPEPDIPPRSRL